MFIFVAHIKTNNDTFLYVTPKSRQEVSEDLCAVHSTRPPLGTAVSHANNWYWTWVAVVKGKRVTTAPVRQLPLYSMTQIKWNKMLWTENRLFYCRTSLCFHP